MKRVLYALLGLLVFATPAFATTTYTSCERLPLPQPGDPAVTNTWGSILNTGTALEDTSIGGYQSIAVGGSANVTLTALNGAADQSRGASFNFTGTLTGNIYVLYPTSGCQMFSVTNSTTGAFTLSVGVNNGAGGPRSGTVTVPQGGTLLLASDGTNVFSAVNILGIGAAQSGANFNITSLNGLTTPLAASEGGSGNATNTANGVMLGEGTSHMNAATTSSTAGVALVSTGTGTDPAFGPVTPAGIGATGVTAGACTYCSVTFNAGGQATAQANGTAPAAAATSAQMETGTATTVYAAPGNLMYGNMIPKAWSEFYYGGGSEHSVAAYNVSGTVRNGTGDYTITLSGGLTFTHGAAVCTASQTGGAPTNVIVCGQISPQDLTTTNPTVEVGMLGVGGSAQDPTGIALVVVYGTVSN